MLNPVTTMFAGHLSKAALDSVALANSLINIFGNAVVLGMTTACDTYFAQAFGNGRLLYIGVLLQRALAIHVLLLLAMCVLYVNMEQLLLLIGQNPEISRLTADYMLVSIPGLFFLFLYTILKKYITCQNYVVSTVVIGFFGLGVNALLQYIFLYQLNYGILGSAVAQSLACFIMFVAIVVYIIWSGVYKTTWNGMQYQMLEDWGPFVKLGLYGMLMICLEWWAYEISNIFSGILGTTELAAQGIFFNIEDIFISVGLGASDATAIRVGQFLGAGEPKKAVLASDVGFTSLGRWFYAILL
ncbi:hypothetical protein CAPTEDRAFT_117091 [Capitella teleta]|uniref:Uncharacterized protein n=1 Tax=Capitella teleta TaxID=283909 RepID=R7UD57_CAPTE|nr:hypothetical protein CAPTEDRAFT_117091 [Capitella teleta]|eukprot:ELU04320.1 hypothetical protein CAPTEDRAFT_117091 [Capitella teleta]